MLKSFKPAKCKTALKLVIARIKLMRNKKGVQINQMKKELAQLLEKGDDRTARIRVEHVIREEKMVAAYDLIEIYCELIAARLPVIESQKTCPIDLKEAVASVIFAAPRCSDITELLDVKKSFTAKYGKEFVIAALELRPNCGVNHMLVEKLSAVPPDIQTKVKVLSGVAKEYNINWEATSFEEKELKPPDDLLNGPTNFEKASTINVDPPKVQTHTVNSVQNHQATQSVPVNYSEQNRRFTSDAQNVTPADIGGTQSSYASTSHDDTRPTGITSGSMNSNQSYRSNSSNSSSGRENYMEFKDATSAAQAAAEAAEHASFAARAAARLSQQYPSEPHDSHIRDERPQVSYNNSFNNRKSNIQNQQMGPNDNNTSPKTTSKSRSSRSRYDSDEDSVNSGHREDRYLETQKISRKEPKTRFTSDDDQSHSYSTTVKDERDYLTSDQQNVDRREATRTNSSNDARKYDETKYDDDQGSSSPEMNLRKESKSRFTSGNIERSKSPSSTIRDKHDRKQKFGRTVSDQDNRYSETKKTSSFRGARRDDEIDTDDDDNDNDGPKFDKEFDYYELEDVGKSFFPSPGREYNRPVENPHRWSPKKSTRNTMDPVKCAKSVDPSVKSDLSYGLDSESESGTVKLSFSGSNKFDSPRKYDTYSAESSPKTNSRKSRIELNDLVETADSDTGKDFPFGTLAGGLRNKGGVKYPPYTRSDSHLSKKPVEESQSPVKVDSTSKQASFNSRPNRFDKKKLSDNKSSSVSESDSFSNKFPLKPSNIRSPFAPPDAFFNDDGSDFEEEISTPKRTDTSKVHSGPQGVSRRTEGQVEPKDKTVISSPSEARPKQSRAQPAENFKKHSNNTQSPPEPRPQTPRSKQGSSGTIPDPKISQHSSFSPKKSPASGKNEAYKTSLEANNIKEPSFVHPKLPDFETLAERVRTLSKMNHQ